MSHSNFLRQLADRTGESLSFLQNRGFSPVSHWESTNRSDLEDDRGPLMVDWDQIDEERWSG